MYFITLILNTFMVLRRPQDFRSHLMFIYATLRHLVAFNHLCRPVYAMV